MNGRIRDFDEHIVDMRCSNNGTRDLLQFKIENGDVFLHDGCGHLPTRIDDDGLRALVEMAQCKLDTGSFAALADTSAVPYVGKRMIRNYLAAPKVECTMVREGEGGVWYFTPGCGGVGCAAIDDFLPLTPAPPKRVRAYTPVEAVEHLGREVLYQDRYYYLAMVGEHHVELSSRDDGIIPKIMHEQFAKVATWRDGYPCGIIEEAT